jgi:hypothetical protein
MTLPADDEPKNRQNMCLKSPANASQEGNRPEASGGASGGETGGYELY